MNILLYGEEKVIKMPKTDEDVIVLPALPKGIEYIAVDSLAKTIVTVYTHLPKIKQRYFHSFIKSLISRKKEKLEPMPED